MCESHGTNVVDRFYTVAVTVGETTTAVNLGEYLFRSARCFLGQFSTHVG